MRPTTYGLRTRVLLLVLFSAIPAMGLLGYSAIGERHKAARDAQINALTLARLAADQQGELIVTIRQLLHGLSSFPEVHQRNRPQACNRIATELVKLHPYFIVFGAVNLEGQLYCSTLSLKRPINIVDRDYFRLAVASRDFSTGIYQVGRLTGVGSINFGYPLLDASDNVYGILYVGLKLSWLNDLIMKVPLPEGSVTMLVDRNGTILARYPDPEQWVGKTTADTAFTQALRSQQTEGVSEGVGPDGVERFYAFAKPREAFAQGTYVHIGIPKAAVLAGINQEFARQLSLLILVAVLALGAAWIGSDRFVSRRVRNLTDAARRLSQGDLAARTGLPHSAEELGQLAYTFDTMAETVELRAHEIEHAKSELQQVNRALRTLNAGTQCLLRATDEQVLLDDMCRVIVEVGGYRTAVVDYAEQDGSKTVGSVAQAGFAGGLPALQALMMASSDANYSRGLLGTAIRTGQHCMAKDILRDPNFAFWRDEARERGYASGAAFPLHVQGKVIGAISVYSGELDAFDQDELKLLDEAANDLAYGIEASRTRQAHEEANKLIRRMAYFDTLTGLPNHTQFEERMKEAAQQAGQRNHSMAVLLVNADRFREINIALGFQQGNVLLKEMGSRLRGTLGDQAMVARMRNQEFAVLLPEAGAELAIQWAQQIIHALDKPFVLEELPVDMHVSIGIALFPDHGADPDRLIRQMDVAVREARKTGNGYALYTEDHEQDQDSHRRLALAGDLRRAIEQGELMLYFQPQIDLQSGHLCGVEALTRWRHPQHGMIPPAEFIPLAEHTGLMRPLTDWVLEAAMRQSYAWRRAGIKVPVAVNLSARNLCDGRLLPKIKELSQTLLIEPGMLELEITESAIMEDPTGALDVLTRLHDEFGMPISIDDFGTGYSSLSYLKKLPVDGIKIDKSFIIDMLTNKDSATIVRSTITLAHDLGLKVVAEGVEDQAVLDRLKALGCDVAQGFYTGRPMPEKEFRNWLVRSPWSPQKPASIALKIA